MQPMHSAGSNNEAGKGDANTRVQNWSQYWENFECIFNKDAPKIFPSGEPIPVIGRQFMTVDEWCRWHEKPLTPR